MCGQLIQASAAIALERDVLRMLVGRGQVTPPSRDDLAGLSSPRAGAARDWRRAGPTPSCASRARSTSSGCTRTRRRPWSRAICREPQLGPWSAGVVALYGLGRTEAGLVGDLGLVQLAGALGAGASRRYETAALLEPYGEWAGLASMHLLALSGRTNGASTCGSARRISRGRLNDTSSCTTCSSSTSVTPRAREPVDDASDERLGRAAPDVMPTCRPRRARPSSMATRPRSGAGDARARAPPRPGGSSSTSCASRSRAPGRPRGTSAFTAACRFEVA